VIKFKNRVVLYQVINLIIKLLLQYQIPEEALVNGGINFRLIELNDKKRYFANPKYLYSYFIKKIE
jgi:hypothetical protein